MKLVLLNVLCVVALVISLRAGGLETRADQAASLCTAATSDPTHCVCNTPNGVIDARSLGNPDKSTKYTPSDALGFSYDLNPCYGVTEDKKCHETVACQRLENHVITHGVGNINTGEFYYDNISETAYLMYDDGLAFTETRINLVCDMSQDTPLVKAEGDVAETAIYVFTITHKCACPGACLGAPCIPDGGIPASGIAAIAVGAVLAILGTGCAAVGLSFFIGAVVMIKNKSKARYEALQNMD